MNCDFINNFSKILNSPFVSSLFGSGIGAVAAIWCTKKTLNESAKQIQNNFESENNNKQSRVLMRLLAEIHDNIKILSNSHYNATVRIWDEDWRRARGTLLFLDQGVYSKCAVAYQRIGQVINDVELKKIGAGGMGSAHSHDDTVKLLEESRLAIEEILMRLKS